MEAREYLPEVSNFNPRSPSGLRLLVFVMDAIIKVFQSTQPEWAATKVLQNLVDGAAISIHAARVGCDQQ